MRLRRAIGWLCVVAAFELVTRTIVYALAPSPLLAARHGLTSALGGPRFSVVLLVAAIVGGLIAVGVVWVASMGVRERWELAADRPLGPRPAISLRRLVARAAGLTLAGWLMFAGVESVIHLRAGLGFHGLDCLVGPVHRNALPVVAGLSLIASALASAVELVWRWMRRTVARFGRPDPVFGSFSVDVAVASSPVPVALRSRRGIHVRGPPAPVV
jgi:hypothetical protein